MSSPGSNKGNSTPNKNNKGDGGKKNSPRGPPTLWNDPPIVQYEQAFDDYLREQSGGAEIPPPTSGPPFPSQAIGGLEVFEVPSAQDRDAFLRQHETPRKPQGNTAVPTSDPGFGSQPGSSPRDRRGPVGSKTPPLAYMTFFPLTNNAVDPSTPRSRGRVQGTFGSSPLQGQERSPQGPGSNHSSPLNPRGNQGPATGSSPPWWQPLEWLPTAPGPSPITPTRGRGTGRGNLTPRGTSTSSGSRGSGGRGGGGRGMGRGMDKIPFPAGFTWDRESLMRLAKWKHINKKSMRTIVDEGIFPGYSADQLKQIWEQHGKQAMRYLDKWQDDR
ncbi:hypothetical protein CC86DRAFT_407969 [Ophiobolus disseminans]|uniref:Uncharacterized protein n=1 Tax=Ophiobolus disseminans TaxID=1469910 RepID=A0A6A6ZUS2_9PLEO|nr:hypothetical protein CC86DRAFT_407969 [Ophiobolus disseminans]